MEKMTNLENQGASSPSQESLLTKGEERYEKAGAFMNSMKEKASSVFSRVSGFFSKAPKTIAVGVLSAPEIGMAGVKKVDQGLDYLEDKGIQFEDWTKNKAEQGSQFVKDKISGGYEFLKNKKDQLFEYAQDKADIAQAVVELSSDVVAGKIDDVTEKIDNVRSKIALQSEKLLEFGQSSLISAQMKKQEVINSWRNKYNALRLSIAEKKQEIQNDRLKEVQAKVASLKQLQDMYQQQSFGMAA
jgi:hypothetical protein